MATGTIQVAWNYNSGYSITSQPNSMTQNDTLNVYPPTEGCTMNFNPALTKAGTSSPTYSSYTFSGTMVAFTMPAQANSYDFSFSVDGAHGKSGADGRSIPVGKT